jgi:hypothetical protein
LSRVNLCAAGYRRARVGQIEIDGRAKPVAAEARSGLESRTRANAWTNTVRTMSGRPQAQLLDQASSATSNTIIGPGAYGEPDADNGPAVKRRDRSDR